MAGVGWGWLGLWDSGPVCGGLEGTGSSIEGTGFSTEGTGSSGITLVHSRLAWAILREPGPHHESRPSIEIDGRLAALPHPPAKTSLPHPPAKTSLHLPTHLPRRHCTSLIYTYLHLPHSTSVQPLNMPGAARPKPAPPPIPPAPLPVHPHLHSTPHSPPRHGVCGEASRSTSPTRPTCIPPRSLSVQALNKHGVSGEASRS